MAVSLPGAKVTAESMEVAPTVKYSPNSTRESSVMATLKERESLGQESLTVIIKHQSITECIAFHTGTEFN